MKLFVKGLITLTLLTSCQPYAPPVASRDKSNSVVSPKSTGVTFPVAFEPNVGQFGESIHFRARLSVGTIVFTKDEVRLSLPLDKDRRNQNERLTGGIGGIGSLNDLALQKRESLNLTMRYIDPNPAVDITGSTRLPGNANYFLGNDPTKWKTDVSTFRSIAYDDLYHGIDLHYTSDRDRIKGMFHIAPYADPSRIRWHFSDAARVRLADNGDLHVSLKGDDSNPILIDEAPIAWQEINSQRRIVDVRYQVSQGSVVSFMLGRYDRSQPLIVDPSLVFSTYLGGEFGDEGRAITVDSSGNVYVTGSTSSEKFPRAGTIGGGSGAGYEDDAFITKLTPEGNEIIYSTYIGSNSLPSAPDDRGNDIVVDGFGNAYIVGFTESFNFPTVNAFQPSCKYVDQGFPYCADAFVAKLNSQGNGLVFSSYLGGLGVEEAMGIARDSVGNIYVAGVTSSSDFASPPINFIGPANLDCFSLNVFVVKLNPDASAFSYKTCLGGSRFANEGFKDHLSGLAVDSGGNAYLVGTTKSRNFPTTNALQANCKTVPPGDDDYYCQDVFVAKLNPSGTAFIYSTFLGGSGEDFGLGIAIDSVGNAYATGWTRSSDFPTKQAFQPNLSGLSDAFVAKVSALGALAYSTYLGGSGGEQPSFGDSNDRFARYGRGDIAVDRDGNAHVVGTTNSADFPAIRAIQQSFAGESDVFISKIVADGRSLAFSTYLGGSESDNVRGLAIDSSGRMYVTGWTRGDFPLVNPYQDTFGSPGNADAFVAKIDETALPPTDVVADAWEVTQGIQSLENDVPLVANKPTFVRLYGAQTSGTRINSPDAVLVGTRDGVTLPGSPLHPLKAGRPLPLRGQWDRASRNEGWLFRLPDSWTTAGTISLGAVIDLRNIYNDPNRTNNILSGQFTFTNKPPLCTVFVPVRTYEPRTSTRDRNFQETVSRFKDLWPISDVIIHEHPYDLPESHFFKKDKWELTNIGDQNAVVSDLSSLAYSFTSISYWKKCQNRQPSYVGMVNPQTDTGSVAGRGDTPGRALWFKLEPYQSQRPTAQGFAWPQSGLTLAHELGHNAGLRHPDEVDVGYPYTGTVLDDRSTSDRTTHFGFDMQTLDPVRPDTTYDLMHSNEPIIWTSDFTWRRLFDREDFAQTVDHMALSSESLSTGEFDLNESTKVVLASGFVNTSTNQVGLGHLWVYPAMAAGQDLLATWQAQAASPTGGIKPGSTSDHQYHLRLSDPLGNILDDREVTLTSIESIGEDSPYSDFSLAFPAPEGTVAKVEFLDGPTMLYSHTVGTSEPTVSILKPGGGEVFTDRMNVSWSAADADVADELLYTVQYSPDNGRTWSAIVTNYRDTSGTGVVTLPAVRLGGLIGDTSEAIIRVLASDGYHTGIATSPRFSVVNQAPQPFIILPNQPAPANEPLVLQGGASDVEDGSVADENLTWTISGRVIGMGREQVVNGLAPGDYEVTLSAQDTKGSRQVIRNSMSIDWLRVPLADAPTLPSTCNDLAYANSARIQLAPYPDGYQATAQLIRTNTDLWVCFNGMNTTSNTSGNVGIQIDINNSRDSNAQTDDYAFLVGENGSVTVQQGDGQGGFIDVTVVEGVSGRSSVEGQFWSAELRISSTLLGGWDHFVGIDLTNRRTTGESDTYHWPFAASRSRPDSWARTLIGDLKTTFLPLIHGSYTPRGSGPDLVGSFSLSPAKSTFSAGEPVQITAIVTNQGGTPADPFWVDFYINPSTPPSRANMTWNALCELDPCFGIAWAVTKSLAPGESVMLVSTLDSFAPANTIWPGWFVAGTSDLYLYIDSFNLASANGDVVESDETNNHAEMHGITVLGSNPAPLTIKIPSELPQRSDRQW